MSPQEKYASKIAKLLRKADSTTPEEAEQLIAKAQELMRLYAIDEELIARAQGENRAVKEQIIQANLEFTGIFRLALGSVGQVVAEANDCKCVYREEKWRKPHKYVLIVTGFESDVRRVEMLNASVQIQAAAALASWYKANPMPLHSSMQRYKARRQFLYGFASGLRSQLSAARQAGEAAAAKQEAERWNVSDEQATESVALVVRERKDQVNDWFDNHYGTSLRRTSRRYDHGGGAADGAGRAAGARAQVNERGLRQQGELNA